MGCPSGVWPPKVFVGVVNRVEIGRVDATNRISGGHSGGSLYDGTSGFLIGVTNWTYFAQGCGSAGPVIVNEGLDRYLPR